MTRFTPLWLQAGSYAASVDRRIVGALWPSGGITGMAVTPAGVMTLNIGAGTAAVPTPNQTGSVLCTSDNIEQVTLAQQPSLNRIDVITVLPRGNDLDGGSNNDFIINVIQGTSAASPVAPAVPLGQLALASVAVGQGVAAIVQANITDRRPTQQLAVVPALSLLDPLPAGAPFTSWTDSAGEVWIAKGGVYGGAWKKARDVLHMAAHRTAAGSVSTSAVLPMNVVDSDRYGLYNSTSGILTIPTPGLWRMDGTVALVPTAAGQWVRLSFR